MRYLAQIMAVFNWLIDRRWRWIFGNAVNGMGDDDDFRSYRERKDGDRNG